MEISPSFPDLRTRIADRAKSMSGWLKFVGVVSILSAVPAALSIVGLVVAWLPIWLGALLIQAGIAAERGSDAELLRMVEKLRTYFVVQGILIITMIVVFGLLFTFFSAIFFEMVRDFSAQAPIWEA